MGILLLASVNQVKRQIPLHFTQGLPPLNTFFLESITLKFLSLKLKFY